MPKERASPGRNHIRMEPMNVRVHPELKRYVEHRAKTTYTSVADYVRQLIINDMEKHNG